MHALTRTARMTGLFCLALAYVGVRVLEGAILTVSYVAIWARLIRPEMNPRPHVSPGVQCVIAACAT
jgi:hypothetical protein